LTSVIFRKSVSSAATHNRARRCGAMESSPGAPGVSVSAKPSFGLGALNAATTPLREEALRLCSPGEADGDASTSAIEAGGEAKSREEKTDESEDITGASEHASEDDGGDGGESNSEEQLTGLAALIRKLTIKKQLEESLREDAVPAVPPPAPVLSSPDLPGIAAHILSGKCQHIIVMCGAGISVSAGIPDFRTPGTGLYDNLQRYDLPHPSAVFELDFFRANPAPFYALAKELYPGRHPPTVTHHFIKLLHDKGLLQRCFTQNIDSLERATGLPAHKIVAAHGNFDTARCLLGHHACVLQVKSHVDRGEAMHCQECVSVGVHTLVKPDIVFFGENLPERFDDLAASDFPTCDLLIVAGTSLEVHPFAGLIHHPKSGVPRLLVNREVVGEMSPRARKMASLVGHGGFGFDFDSPTNRRDALFLGDCDDGFCELAQLLGWKEELTALAEAGRVSCKGQTS
jgi:NAD-dependent deacetylase sirtuin 2